MMKKVSIIIPAYNKADLTVKTVYSVLNQTYRDIEIIVVDDGSTDDTRERLLPFSDKIRYVYKTNGGACSARNMGIRLAAGEYIGFLDCDDMYLPQKVDKSVCYLEENPDFGFVHTPVYFIDENDYAMGASLAHKNCPVGWVAKKLVLGNSICNSTVIVRKACFEKIGFFDETIFIPADWDMWLRLAEQHKVGYIPIPLTSYRASGNYTLNNLGQSEKEELMVVEKAIQRDSKAYLPFRDKLVSNVYYRHALWYLAINDFDKSKERFSLSVRQYLFNPKALFLLAAMTVTGHGFCFLLRCYRFIPAIKRRLLRDTGYI